jgi:hypothetical protein
VTLSRLENFQEKYVLQQYDICNGVFSDIVTTIFLCYLGMYGKYYIDCLHFAIFWDIYICGTLS